MERKANVDVDVPAPGGVVVAIDAHAAEVLAGYVASDLGCHVDFRLCFQNATNRSSFLPVFR